MSSPFTCPEVGKELTTSRKTLQPVLSGFRPGGGVFRERALFAPARRGVLHSATVSILPRGLL